jgi:ubiquinone/menaquinone biosynthesis C-methylase UbiE
MREIDLKEPFESSYFREYYTNYRNKLDDLFESERRFINEFIEGGASCLDIGCALGGMFDILSGLQSGVKYTGIDISPKLLTEAERLHPAASFLVHDGARLPFGDRSYSRVITLGTTVHDQSYRQLVAEAWRVTDEKLFFDIRITPNPELRSLSEGYVEDGAGMRYPYVVANAQDLFAWMAQLPDLGTIKAYGYWGTANTETTLPPAYAEICMTCVLLEKTPSGSPAGSPPRWQLDLPLSVQPS